MESVKGVVSVLESGSALLREVYSDALSPAAKQIGIALEAVLGVVSTTLLPIRLLNEKSKAIFESNVKKYAERVESIPKERLIEVAPEVGVPIIEKLTYVADVELSDMYVRLLATASDSVTQGEAHPAFHSCIERMAPDEARLMKALSRGYGPSHEVTPSITATWASGTTRLFVDNLRTLLPEDSVKEIDFRKMLPAYLSNLASMGLIVIESDGELSRDIYSRIYDFLEHYWSAKLEASAPQGFQKLQFMRGNVCLSSFGTAFLGACMRD